MIDNNKEVGKDIQTGDVNDIDITGTGVVIKKLGPDDEIITGKLTKEEYDRKIDF